MARIMLRSDQRIGKCEVRTQFGGRRPWLGAGVGAYRASANPANVYVGLLVSLLVAARSAKHLEWIHLY